MSTSTSTFISTFSKPLALYFGIPTLIMGVFGNVCNIIVFLSLKTFRRNACALFLTIMSFVNIGQLLTSLFTRIMITGFQNNWTETSISFCKFRNYCLQACALTSFTCMCLATIDQYLATSLRPRWQQYLTIRRAYILCVIFFIFWLIHGIPTLIWFSPIILPSTGSITCMTKNSIHQEYLNYIYTLILVGILPIILTVLFGSLAYHNVRQIPYRTVPLVRRELDKQLTSMVLIQVVHNFLVIVPYISVLLILKSISAATLSTNYIILILTNTITGFIYYLYFASPFYIYVCVSKRFRQQLSHVIFHVCNKRANEEIFTLNHVWPVSQQH